MFFLDEIIFENDRYFRRIAMVGIDRLHASNDRYGSGFGIRWIAQNQSNFPRRHVVMNSVEIGLGERGRGQEAAAGHE